MAIQLHRLTKYLREQLIDELICKSIYKQWFEEQYYKTVMLMLQLKFLNEQRFAFSIVQRGKSISNYLVELCVNDRLCKRTGSN